MKTNIIYYFFLDLIKKKLLSEINNIDKTKKECEDEFKYKLNNNRKIASKINIQFDEIQKLMGELKFDISALI